MLVESGGARQIAQACAVLSERHLLPPRTATTASDLLSALDQWGAVPPQVKRVAEVIADLGLRLTTESTIKSAARPSRGSGRPEPVEGRNPQSAMPEEAFRRAILSGYPDPVSHRREPGSPSV